MEKTKKNRAAVQLGRLGGRAGTGKAKARTPDQARAAARRRWELFRQRKRESETKSDAKIKPIDHPELN